jgi:hypothetical protein
MIPVEIAISDKVEVELTIIFVGAYSERRLFKVINVEPLSKNEYGA